MHVQVFAVKDKLRVLLLSGPPLSRGGNDARSDSPKQQNNLTRHSGLFTMIAATSVKYLLESLVGLLILLYNSLDRVLASLTGYSIRYSKCARLHRNSTVETAIKNVAKGGQGPRQLLAGEVWSSFGRW